jgi:acyl-coenzyme A synthetase/AMP-(fatty) acid ligase
VGTTSGWVTYAEMQSLVNGVRALLASHGVTAGSRVVLAVPNVKGAVACWLAVQSLGAASVELDREWSEAALAEAVRQAKPVVAIISWRDAKKWRVVGPLPDPLALEELEELEELGERETLAGLLVMHPTPPPDVLRALLGERYLGWISEDGVVQQQALPTPGVTEPEVAQIVFTSGTTRAPRGVLQTTKNLCASTDGIVEYLQLTSADRALLVLPLFYVYGKSVLLAHLRVGGSVFMDHRFMYPRVVMESIGAERCTNFAGVPLTFEILRRQVDLSPLDLTSLRFVTQAGGPMQQDTITWARAAFAPAPLYVMYGQTEATSRLSYLPPAWALEKKGSIGRGMPGVELRVVDAQGTPVPPGVEGHLVARGEVVMPGYLDAPEETSKVLKGGWLWTGDLATWDSDGFVFITGRAKQVLKLGGHRVAPAELEHALTSRAGVREAVVVGAPDGLEGEVAIAFVISDDALLDQSVLLRHCRSLLPAPRVPRRVVLVPDFPRNTAGKVLLGELQKLAAALHFADPFVPSAVEGPPTQPAPRLRSG